MLTLMFYHFRRTYPNTGLPSLMGRIITVSQARHCDYAPPQCRVPCLRPGCAAATGASEVLREGARLRICSWPHENSEFVRILVLRVVAFHFLNKIVNMPLS